MTDRPENALDADHPLLVAARYNDAETEDTSLSEALERHGLDLNEIEYAAEQRAVRIVLLQNGRVDEARSTESIEVHLNEQEQSLFHALVPLYIDAIFIGWRARSLSDGQ